MNTVDSIQNRIEALTQELRPYPKEGLMAKQMTSNSTSLTKNL